MAITRPDQVWSTDITYVSMCHGFLYLVAVMDWCSRYVLSWRLSNTIDGGFCLEALDEALCHGRPEILSSDQRCQFTAVAFTSRLESCGIAINMDGRGRALDNVSVERLWRSVKYEEVYLRDYATAWETEGFLASYFRLLLPGADTSIARRPDAGGGLSSRLTAFERRPWEISEKPLATSWRIDPYLESGEASASARDLWHGSRGPLTPPF